MATYTSVDIYYIYILMMYTAWLYKHPLIYSTHISVDDTQCMAIYIYIC